MQTGGVCGHRTPEDLHIEHIWTRTEAELGHAELPAAVPWHVELRADADAAVGRVGDKRSELIQRVRRGRGRQRRVILHRRKPAHAKKNQKDGGKK